MKKKVLVVLLVGFLWITGITFGTISFLPSIVHDAETTKILEENEKKNENIRLTKTYARIDRGWTGKEWTCLHKLWYAESRFDSKADNPKSSAFGIAQLLGEKSRVPTEQILRGFRYLERRYGANAPCRAWAFHQRHGWY